MGIIGKIAVGAIKMASEPLVLKGIEAANNAVDAKRKSRDQELMESHPDMFKLRIKQRPYTVKSQFEVFDASEQVKYRVKGSFLSPKPVLTIFNASGKRLGSVKQKMTDIRNPLDAMPEDHVAFVFEVNGTNLGVFRTRKLYRRFSFDMPDKEERHTSFELDFMNWTVRWSAGLSMKNEVVDSRGQTIAYINSNIWSRGDCYVISYSDVNNELLFLMITLALDSEIDDSTRIERISDKYHNGHLSSKS